MISAEASVQLMEFSPKFEMIARVAMEQEMMGHQEVVASLLTLNPEERYLDLLEKNPEIFQRIPLHYIA